VDNIQSYPALLRLDWAFDNQEIINLKKRKMIFEGGGLKVTIPLDPKKERRYVEPTRKEIYNLYNMTVCMDDYINSTIDGVQCWRSISLLHQTQRKDLNIGNTSCMKYRPKYVLTLLALYVGSKQRYVR
jgi:hypothetical protein